VACRLTAARLPQTSLVGVMTNPQVSRMIQIQLNGELHTIESPATVATLVAVRKPRPPFSVEVNKELVRRPCYETTGLSDGDQVEIVTLVGGG